MAFGLRHLDLNLVYLAAFEDLLDVVPGHLRQFLGSSVDRPPSIAFVANGEQFLL